MKIGICGAHRTGKTTLAKELSKELNIPYISFNAGQFFEERGLSPSEYVELETRLEIQKAMLGRYYDIATSNKSFITDRTPADFFAYTIFDLTNLGLESESIATKRDCLSYISDCKIILANTLDLGIFVRPGIPIVYEEMKASIEELAILKTDALINSFVDDKSAIIPFYKINEDILDLDIRVKLCSLAANQIQSKQALG